MEFQDHFSRQAELYAKSRPDYPDELFYFLSSVVSSHETCWDCATGNGQAAVSLAKYFNRVIATDGSESQIRNARPSLKVEYRVAIAELCGLEDHSVDLITVATAAHWLQHDLFYEEVKRVSKSDALLAVWTYSEATIQGDIDELMRWFMYDLLEPYWPAGREYVRGQYKNLPFPFPEIATPDFFCRREWTKEQWLNYVRSWSAYNEYVVLQKSDPIDELLPRLEPLWNDIDVKMVVWRLHLRCGRL